MLRLLKNLELTERKTKWSENYFRALKKHEKFGQMESFGNLKTLWMQELPAIQVAAPILRFQKKSYFD